MCCRLTPSTTGYKQHWMSTHYVYSLMSIQIKNFLTQYYSLSSESGRHNTLNSETNVTIGISIYTKEYWLTSGHSYLA